MRHGPLTAVLCLTLASACGAAPEPAPEPAASDAVPVTAGIARIETLRDALVVPGQVVPSSLTDWTVTAPGPGTVAELPVAEGDAVSRGDLLVRFDVLSMSAELDARRLALALAERAESDAADELDRLESLFNRGLVPRNDVEAARSAAMAANTSAAQARNELALVEELQRANRITARFDGVVASVSKAVGDYADGSTADAVLRVIDPTQTQIAVELPVDQVNRVSIGQTAAVTAPRSVEPLVASVARVDMPAAGAAGPAVVRFNYTAPEPLDVDTPVRLEMVLDERADAVVVPTDAVLSDQAGAYVLLAGPDLVARRRGVRVGLVVEGLAQILQGLEAGERIIIGSASQVVDGQAILVSR